MLKVPEMKPVQRIQANFLAKAERRALTWMCARLPAWVTPDVLTALGLFGAFIIFAGYVLSAVHPAWLWLVVAGFVVHWLGDSLDGSLARFRRIERPDFGYFIDHSTDGLANLLILAGLGFSPFVRLDIALFALAGYLLLSVHAFLAARVVGELRLSYLNAGPTELRLALIAITLAMFTFGALPVLHGLTAFDLIVGSVGLVLVALFVIQTLVTARDLTLK
ncbi:CDP-alcohol phosphatidyltransferase family protein [Sphingomonas sp. MAH-20]|uniref:CDP-alcohol phosphatidyltransferase family protein n=1 Tax=Sphingomonas horti TaxID=2682842 RepID=A0A6I4J452_9SPHN|nr:MULTISPECIES: CDP-alcohol phosphatidyltransferase family protein [Sphingomonas]MBA2921219.1 CDP-alcohol phosphatidyltransferase family protein [Sphingomonas sp. CGMCC 1.13658]MVO79460.1 CDP-alcohol phosphatidyltransferase family protein [Sphingomonas horti]